jgi:GntR family transcriptional regulator / MocR family aminotransferase
VELHVSLVGRRDLAGQVYRQVRAAVLERRLRPGDRLPSSRELAARLGVSRNTVVVAYDRLVAEGFLAARGGVGTRVSDQVRALAVPGARTVDAWLPVRPVWGLVPDPPELMGPQPRFDFRAGIPDAREFPFATWRALMAKQFRRSAIRSGAYGDPAGDLGLRDATARHIAVSRGVRATGADVVVTSGVQQAIDLLARVLLEPGDTVAVEDPGYGPVMLLLRTVGARVVGVPVDSEGLVVDALPREARLVYVTPSHQFPLGTAMSLSRRLALLEWAERHRAVVVEDDYDSEFRYAGRPIEPLHSLGDGGRVLYVGSFSKALLPILRLGFVVVPPSLHAPVRKAKLVADWHTELPLQAALAEFIEQGLLARHIRRMRRIYAERHHRVTTVLRRDFADHLAPIPSLAGLHVSALLTHPHGHDVALADRARTLGVEVWPLSQFAISNRPAISPPGSPPGTGHRNPPRQGLLVGYGAIPTDRIDAGLYLLRCCFD